MTGFPSFTRLAAPVLLLLNPLNDNASADELAKTQKKANRRPEIAVVEKNPGRSAATVDLFAASEPVKTADRVSNSIAKRFNNNDVQYNEYTPLTPDDLKPGMNKEDLIQVAVDHGLFSPKLLDRDSTERKAFDVSFSRLEESHFDNLVIVLSELARKEVLPIDTAREIPTLNSGKTAYALAACLNGYVDNSGNPHILLDRNDINGHMRFLRGIPDLSTLGVDRRAVIEDQYHGQVQEQSDRYLTSLQTTANH